MSLKNMDNKNRWRSKTVGFRVSPEEDAQIETAVRELPIEIFRLYKLRHILAHSHDFEIKSSFYSVGGDAETKRERLVFRV